MNEQGLFQRTLAALKVMSGAMKAIPHPDAHGYGGAVVPIYSDWAAWDRARDTRFNDTRIDYATKAGDPSASSLIMSGVRWLGSTLPEAELTVKQTGGEKGESEMVADHRLAALWRKPNAYYSGATLMKSFAFSWLTKGEVYIRKVRDGMGNVSELWYEPHWLIRPRWLGDERMGDGRGAFISSEMDDPAAFINYYEVYRGRERYRLEREDVIHFRDQLDTVYRCGTNGLFSILREVFADNEAANYYAALMANQGVPKFILVADPDVEISDERRREVTDEVNRASTGDNRGRVLALSGMKPYKLPWSPEELDLRASRYMSEERFAAVTGIPATELELGAGAERSIYNNVRQASERATERVLVPLWKYIEQELNVQLLPDFEREGARRYCRFDTGAVRALAEDEDAKAKRLALLFTSGGIMRSEFRSGMGYGPSDEANEEADRVFYTPQSVRLEPPAPPVEEDAPLMLDGQQESVAAGAIA